MTGASFEEREGHLMSDGRLGRWGGIALLVAGVAAVLFAFGWHP